MNVSSYSNERFFLCSHIRLAARYFSDFKCQANDIGALGQKRNPQWCRILVGPPPPLLSFLLSPSPLQSVLLIIGKGWHTCIHTYIHTYMHACIHTYMHTYIHTLHTLHNIHYITYITYIHTYHHHKGVIPPPHAMGGWEHGTRDHTYIYIHVYIYIYTLYIYIQCFKYIYILLDSIWLY